MFFFVRVGLFGQSLQLHFPWAQVQPVPFGPQDLFTFVNRMWQQATLNTDAQLV